MINASGILAAFGALEMGAPPIRLNDYKFISIRVHLGGISASLICRDMISVSLKNSVIDVCSDQEEISPVFAEDSIYGIALTVVLLLIS